MSPSGQGTSVALMHQGRPVMLKWHKLRQAAGQPAFDPDNLRTGLALGASLEVDIRALADRAWVCLHDERLDQETDGSGPVSGIDSAAVARLRVAGGCHAPPLLADIARRAAEAGPTGACLQLDLKQPAERLSNPLIATLAESIAPIVPVCLLSGYDWRLLTRVGAAIPGLRLGFDPYELAQDYMLDTAAEFADFTHAVLKLATGAAAFYLHHRFVSAALAAGVNPIEILQTDGAMIDVWTLDPTTPDIASILHRVIEAGADQVTTNDPIAMAQLWARGTP